MTFGCKSRCLLTTIVLLACGKVDADRQPETKLEKPPYQIAEQGFFLNDGSYSKTFEGSTLVWVKDPNTSGVSEVARTSRQMILNGVKQLEFIDNNILPLKDQFDQVYPRLVAKKTQYVMKSYQLALPAAATWFGGADGKGGVVGRTTLALATIHQQPFTEAEQKQIGQNFGLYCEAKLWERTVHPRWEFRGRRPTPAGLCEGYYQMANLISPDAPLCQQSATFKNFFPCWWHEGVLKTNLWRARYPAGSAVDTAMRALSDEALMNAFAQDDQGIRLMQARRFTADVGDESQVIDLSFDTNLPGLLGLTTEKIISHVELKPASDSNALRFFSLEGRNEPASMFLTEAENDLRDDLKYFLSFSPGKYVNENAFNQAFAKPNKDPEALKYDWNEAEARARFPTILNIQDPELQQLQQEIGPLVGKVQGIGAKVQQLGKELSKKDCDGLKTLGCEGARLAARANAVTAPADVSKAMWQSRVTLNKSEDGALLFAHVFIVMKSEFEHVACVKIKPESKAECPKSKTKSKLQFNEDTGHLLLTMPIIDADEQGLQPSPRAMLPENFTFNELSHSEMHGANIVYSASLSLVDKILLTLVGDVRVEKNNKVLYYGAIKFRESAPPQQVAAGQLQAALEELARQ